MIFLDEHQNIKLAMKIGDRAALGGLQNELIQLVHGEQEAQRKALQRLWSKPLEERLEEGRSLASLRVIRILSGGTIVFACAENDSRFREGDIVRLSQGDPEIPAAEAFFVAGNDERVELRLWGLGKIKHFSVGSEGWQIDESAVDLEKRFLAALDDLGKTETGRNKILPLLSAANRPVLDAGKFEEGLEGASKDGFDDRQAEAVASAIATDLCWLIHGPPGTGKTRVLAWIVADLVAKGERVLVTGFTHRSINNLLEAISHRLGDGRLIAKITPFIDPAFPLPQFEYFRESPQSKSDSGYVIGSTPFSLRSSRLAGVDFDTIVMDESSQVTLPLAIMAMLAGQKYIFAGDHKQLPPVTLTRPPQEAVELSIFGRLVGRGFDTMLTASRRLNAPLCAWPSESFYQSRLISHPQVAERRLALKPGHSQWAGVLDPNHSFVWLEIPHQGSRTVSMEEVTVACELLVVLQQHGVEWEDVGVVVPFRRQARMIRRHLGRKLQKTLGPGELVIDTVERMQGQEREVILISLTTSDGAFALKMAEFLFQPQRLNVAATRARTKLILLASSELLELAETGLVDELGGDFVALLKQAHRVELPLPG